MRSIFRIHGAYFFSELLDDSDDKTGKKTF